MPSVHFETAKASFITRMTEMGVRVVGEYKNSNMKIECRCPLNHICKPTPSSIQRGGPVCKVCAYRQSTL